MSNKCFDGLRCSSLACVGDRCLRKEMTQHTETATPKRYDYSYSHGGMIEESSGSYVSHDDYAVLQAKLAEAETASRMWHDHYQRLMDERDTLRRERNELREKLADLRQHYDDTVTRANAAEIRELELRTKLAQTEKTRDGWLTESQEWRAKYHLERDKLAQAQNEAQSARLIIKAIISDLPVSRDWLDPSTERAAFNFLSTISPNSAEGEPG